ncbi:MAG: hypothetical protein ACXWJM_06750 [Ramlibacter sp.]
MRNPLHFLVLLAATLTSFCVTAAPPGGKHADEVVVQVSDSHCRKEVSDYVQAVRFVRQSAGPKIGEKITGAYVSEAELEKVAATQGACSASQLLRQKGVAR